MIVTSNFSHGRSPSSMTSTSSDSDEETTQPSPEQHGPRLLWAARWGKLEEVARLLDIKPALVDFADEDGYTAMHRAAYMGRADIVEALLARGANLHAVTFEEGWTPLHSACHWGQADVVIALLAAGADVNALSSGGNTPLHTSASSGPKAKPVLQVLMMRAKDLDTSAVNNAGDTAEDVARRTGAYPDYFRLLNPDVLYLSEGEAETASKELATKREEKRGKGKEKEAAAERASGADSR